MTKLTNFLSEYQRPIHDPLELDLALFSRLVELPLTMATSELALPALLPDFCATLLAQIQAKDYLTLPADRQLLEQIAHSNRYQKVTLEKLSPNNEHFLAITLGVTKTLKVLAFRGPNGTLLSWRKDLHFALTDPEALQTAAQAYLQRSLQADDRQIICVGFSRGAAIAALACDHLTTPAAQRIQQVLLFESPGLPVGKYHFDVPVLELMAPLSVFSLVGIHPFPQRTVNSLNAGIWQHGLTSWTADRTGSFASAVGIAAPAGFDQSPFFKQLSPSITEEDANRIVDVLFTVFREANYPSIPELIKHWNQFTGLIHQQVHNENSVVQLSVNRIQQIIFQNAATNLQTASRR
ncbi:Mbeg1-like protein [Pediococcus acidilactici]|uniref:Mbeg1-like protein n=1 Tax=Pediococcus acidilactici TaxID=1254 RepID=UPI00148EE2E7|nr:Mbeg1-like protein [Pediococcus acidilactici]QJW86128.1 DUF2974 domain-containing protein [Pediococcus acidilactici]QYI94976.1 DUF2974 domain-containing protein [Pediococcus acidilactici]